MNLDRRAGRVGEHDADIARVLADDVSATEWCRRCHGPNVIWSAASPLWNFVMRGNDINGDPKFGDMVCIPCFITLATEAGVPDHGWRLTNVAEPDGLIYRTPSGRVWDGESFMWVGTDT